MSTLIATHGGVELDHIIFFIIALVALVLAMVDVVRSRASSLTSDAAALVALLFVLMWWP